MALASSRLSTLATVLLSLAASAAFGETWFVRKGGNDQADGKTPATAFASVLRAVQAVNHGDSIVIGPGTYRGGALLAERFSAHVRPWNPEGVFAGMERMEIKGDEDGKLTGEPPGPVVLEPTSPAEPALHLYRLRHVTVSGLTFRGIGQGLKIEKCIGPAVERCTFEGLSRGLVAEETALLNVQSCVLDRCVIGAFLKGVRGVTIQHATVARASAVGILFLTSAESGVFNSIFVGNNSNLVADAVSAQSCVSYYNVLTGTTGPWGSVPVTASPYEWAAPSDNDHQSMHVPPDFLDPEKGNLRPDPAVTWGGGLPGIAGSMPIITDEEVLGRDGKSFSRKGTRGNCREVGPYAYPEPHPGPGWAKLGISLPEERWGSWPLRQSAGVYRPDGSLVRTLLADAVGVRELYWDGLDDIGQPAPPGEYEARIVSHAVRLVDDGAVGDNGNPMGAYNCDNADRVVALPDGGFVITTVYDEAGFGLRKYASSGQPVFAVNLAENDFTGGIALAGEFLIGAIGKGEKGKLVRLDLTGERMKMANGAESYPVFAAGEKANGMAGVAVIEDRAYVGIPDLNLVRVIDLATGKKVADWALAGAGDVAAEYPPEGVEPSGGNAVKPSGGRLWAIAGKDVVSLKADGQVEKRYPTGLETPQYLAAGYGRLAVVDRKAARIAWMDAASGKVIRTLGQERPKGQWVPVAFDLFNDPRDAAILPDGQLLLTESARLRCFWPESGKIAFEALSNFMDSVVVHPTRPEILYCHPGVFRCDPKSGAWEWLVESPKGTEPVPGSDKARSLSLGSPHGAVVLGGRPFIFYYNHDGKGSLRMLDVSDPLKPRMALDYDNRHRVLNGWAYATVGFTKGGDLVAGAHYGLQFKLAKFQGLDAQNNPQFDFENPIRVGPEKDPTPRGMKCINAIAPDRVTGDFYYLAVTDLYQKMVPGWGADGTGVGRSAPDGRPLWFALSSGGNYQSISMVNDGKQAWVFAAKSFGGQIDLFDADGLRLTTGNWSWPCHYGIGFVDLRYGVHAYLRPDGKPGAYVEDDAIGRFARCVVVGADTIKRRTEKFTWAGTDAKPGEPPLPDRTQGRTVERRFDLPKVPALKVDGDWTAWERAGVVPQIIALPIATFRRTVPDDLWQTFRQGTAIGALAHDGANLYAYFVVTDDTPIFDDTTGGRMWMYDGVELWLEVEQFGIGFLRDGTPMLFKYRFHNREGKEWAANYPLPRECVWGAQLDNLEAHPLGRQLAAVTGVSFRGKKGYAVMARIPFAEVQLVGGIAGRGGTARMPMTGRPGEVVRVGVAFGGVTAWGREQDFKITWPASLMFSDPTRSCPFIFRP